MSNRTITPVPRDQCEGDQQVHRICCDECGAYLFDEDHRLFVRDCPDCGDDVLQQPLDPALQSFYDSAPTEVELRPCDSPRAALYADWDGKGAPR
jgi:hypothetical protein